MTVSGETLLHAFRRAIDLTGVDPSAVEVRDRRRLEAEIEREVRRLSCCDCGEFDWGGE